MWSECLNLLLFSLEASDYGVRLPILRSSPEDQVLYQTERYNEDTFGYDIPIRDEGDYILVMKYAEVYFAQSQQKVRGPVQPSASASGVSSSHLLAVFLPDRCLTCV